MYLTYRNVESFRGLKQRFPKLVVYDSCQWSAAEGL